MEKPFRNFEENLEANFLLTVVQEERGHHKRIYSKLNKKCFLENNRGGIHKKTMECPSLEKEGNPRKGINIGEENLMRSS